MDKTNLHVIIPAELNFSDLKLRREIDGQISFSWRPLEKICAASGINIDIFLRGHEDNVAGLIVAWYAEHRAQGGAADPTAEDLIAEVKIENARGGGISHPPGHA